MDSQTKYELLERYGRAKGDWENWRSLYDEAYSYTMPERDPWPEQIAEGTRKNIGVYDTSAVASSRRLVSRLHKSLVPPGERWFSLEAGNSVLNPLQRAALNTQLQNVNDILYKEILKSNFDLIVNELFQDLIIGTGAMMILENDNDDAAFRCKSIPLNRIFPEGDAFDEINTVWREVRDMDGRDIQAFWPNAEIPEEMRQQMRADEMVMYNFQEGFVYHREEKKWRHVVFADGIMECILDEMVESTPWIVARWSKNSQEVGGRGPIIDALPTIRSLNKLVEDILINVGLSTSPPWVAASDGVFNPYLFEIAPNKVIPVSRQSMGNLPLQKLDVSGQINTSSLEVNDMRVQIKDILFDQPLRPVQGPAQTATESMIRHQAFLDEIGPAWGRLQVELLPKAINRIIFILQRKGLLSKHLRVDGNIINIKYKSPLEQSAAMNDVQNLMTYAQNMSQILGPQLMIGTFNLQYLPQWMAEKLQVDPNLIKGPAEVQQALTSFAQSNQQPNPVDQVGSPNQSILQAGQQQQAKQQGRVIQNPPQQAQQQQIQQQPQQGNQ